MDIPTTIYRDYIKKFNLCDCESIRLDVLGGYIQDGRKKVSSKYEICSIVNSTLIIKCRCCYNIYLIDYIWIFIIYEIYNKFEAYSTDTSFYIRDTNGLAELTLSTCTDESNDQRTIVFAKQI